MGFYIKDLYVSSAKWRPHDPLTNPPTVPETSPVFFAAKYLRDIIVVGGRGNAMPNPDDDSFTRWTRFTTWPTPTPTPWAELSTVIHEEDYLSIRETLVRAVEVVDKAMSALQPTVGQLDEAIDVLNSARG